MPDMVKKPNPSLLKASKISGDRFLLMFRSENLIFIGWLREQNLVSADSMVY
jgi:hypothetical protein